MSKILIDHTVLEQALEDMEMTINYVQSPTRREDMRDSIEALRAALEQEKSPQNASSALQASCEVPQVTDQTEHFLVLADEEVYCTKYPQVEQEPVVWMFQHEETGRIMYVDAQQIEWGFEKNNPRLIKVRPAYLHPQPPRQPLTDEQIEEATGSRRDTASWLIVEGIARAVEAAHGIGGEA